MGTKSGRRGWAILAACVVVGLGLGTLAGFFAGLLRPHQPSGYTPVYVPPPSADDNTTSV